MQVAAFSRRRASTHSKTPRPAVVKILRAVGRGTLVLQNAFLVLQNIAKALLPSRAYRWYGEDSPELLGTAVANVLPNTFMLLKVAASCTWMRTTTAVVTAPRSSCTIMGILP